MKKNKAIIFLGLKIYYPSTKDQVYSVVAFSLFIVLLAIVIFVYAKKENLAETKEIASVFTGVQTNSIRVSENGEITKQNPTPQIQFMTPSENTWNFYKKTQGFDEMSESNKRDFEKKHEWVKKADNTKVETFGKEIKNKKLATGYRYFEYVGEGSTQKDKALWWVVTLKSDEKIEEFVNFYMEFWNPPKDIYMELSNVDSDVFKKQL